MTDPHPFTQYVRTLGRGKTSSRNLSFEEAGDAMSLIMQGQVEPEQLGAFLMLLRVKEETPDEVAGFCSAVRSHWALPLPDVQVDLDWSCYAGKKRHLPWLVLSQLLLGQMGYRQCIHGTRGHTPARLYIEDVYDALGLPVIRTPEALSEWVPDRPAVIPISLLAPQLEDIIQLRHLLGLRSPVHSFARLLNPFNAPTVLQGIFHPGYHQIHQHAAARLNYQCTLVIKGDGGEFERNPDADLTLYWSDGGDTHEEQLDRVFPQRHAKLDHLSLSDLCAVWHGKKRDEYGEAAVVRTASLALMAHERLSEPAALQRVEDAWANRDRDAIPESAGALV